MRLWTVQPLSVWKEMETGVAVRVDPENPKYGGQRPWQYEWLAAALERYGSGFDGAWPWWLTCEEPDPVRLAGQKLPGGHAQIVLELDLPEDRCVVFPLWIWETIHCGHYVARSRSELDAWDRRLRTEVPDRTTWPLPDPWRAELEKSWMSMFDRDVDPRCWYRDEVPPPADPERHELMERASDGLAGLTQELRASDVVDTHRFDALA